MLKFLSGFRWYILGPCLAFAAISALLFFAFNTFWPWGWAVAIVLFFFSFKSDSEKKGYKF